MADHTPGPWTTGADPTRVESEHEHGWANDGWIVCDCKGPDAIANARLIAAAPDLLAALKAALDASGCDGDLCMYQWHEDARAAIAKAEGRSNETNI